MTQPGINEIGAIIRNIRKERGLRLEDLADQNISPATISNIERGVPHVSLDKCMYVLNKLDIDQNQLSDLLADKRQGMDHLEFELLSIETMNDIGSPNDALKELNRLNLADSHPYAAVMYYIKGKCYNSLKKLHKAEKCFHNAIRLASQSDALENSNIEAASYTELGLCHYYQNNLEEALSFTENGMEAFVSEGERPHFRFVLLRNKAIYLERLNRFGEALKVVEGAWKELDQIGHMQVVLGFYCLKAELLYRTGQYDDAIEVAREGLDKARMECKHDTIFTLWTIMASIHMAKREWRNAERCFQLALFLKGTSVKEKFFAFTYSRLGVLYIHQERWNEAEKVIDLAIQIGERYHDAPRLLDAFVIKGDFHRIQKQYREAIPFYQKAEKLAHQYKYKNKLGKILFRMAKCWEFLDDKEFQACLQNMYNIKKETEEMVEDDLEEIS
ncbi:helix-turn-helix transcriptional regulator [Melghirimyces algeriensis]|uniref:Transcriptional regulator, contains XRE-family HTH domain n=1 Tax=Melghirimyces algeriensis TaxID=910412 RepID=A0A521E0I8_9BACL|nr:helix-turn-helix transcriptional regulator [Melghirimyces algeriensis]SMO77473.1 Transcriptional regulator, contains XRE-family HTH domain [Melghirimyces algeriensis]